MHLCVALQELLGLTEPPHFLVPGYTATVDRWLDPRTQQIQTSAEIYPLVRHHQALLNAVFGIGNLVWQPAPWQEGLCDPIVLETYRHQFLQLWDDHDLIVHFARNEQFSLSYTENYSSFRHKDMFSRNMHSQRSGNEEITASTSKTTSSESSLLAERGASCAHDTVQEHRESEEYLSENDRTPSSLEEIAIANADRLAVVAKRDLVKRTYSVEEAQRQSLLHQKELKITHRKSKEIPPDSPLPQAQGYVLRLFVSGHSAATEYTLMSLHQLLEHSLRLPYTLKVIDVFKHPDQAEANQISATPTLLRVWPQPVRRIVGDLTDAERILRLLVVPED